MRHLLHPTLAAIVTTLLITTSESMIAADGPAPAPALKAILADYDRYLTEVDPIAAGQRGDLGALARWPDNSPKVVAENRVTLTALLTALKPLAAAGLDEEGTLNRDLLRERIALELDGFTFDEERIPFNNGDGFFTVPDYAADGIVLRSEAAARAWIAKLAALPAYYSTETANMRRGLKDGFVRPRLTVAQVVRTLNARAAQAPEANLLLKPLAALPSTIPAPLRASLQVEGLEVVQSKIKPAEKALAEFFEREYLPRASTSLGITELPGARDYYAYLIRRHASTSLTAQAIHELGLAEVARIRADMMKVIAETGFRGDFAEFLASLRADKKFVAASVDDYLEKTRDIAKRVDALLPRYFKTLPRLTYGVRLVPPELKGSSAGYYPGSPEQGVAGAVVVNLGALDQSPLYGLPAWTLHEGVPGHHLQIALAQERFDLPLFRRNSDINAYVEGWALYSEHLGVEMGIYRTPYEHFGRLSLEMWRACRLVVDTGLHVKGWTRDQAVALLRENTALSHNAIDYEVDRYIAWPGQALGYKIGEIRIRQMRARAQAALGQKFDLRAFHDAILWPGPMSLDALDRQVDRWIEAAGK